MTEIQIDPVRYHGRPDKPRISCEEAAYDLLDRAGVPFDRLDHTPTATIACCHAVEQYLNTKICKNLFLCNRQKTRFYLLICPEIRYSTPKTFLHRSPPPAWSFAPGETMEKLLGTTPGSASVLSLLFDREHQVQLLVDRDVLGYEYFACHPCINTSSLQFKTADLLDKLLPALGVKPLFVTL